MARAACTFCCRTGNSRTPLKGNADIIAVILAVPSASQVEEAWKPPGLLRQPGSHLEALLQPHLQRDAAMQPKEANASDTGGSGPLTASAFSSDLEVIRERMLDVCLCHVSREAASITAARSVSPLYLGEIENRTESLGQEGMKIEFRN